MASPTAPGDGTEDANEDLRTTLGARELESAKNSPELIAQHLEVTKVRKGNE